MSVTTARNAGAPVRQETVASAAEEVIKIVDAKTWLRDVAGLDKQTPLSRLNCFVGRRWLSMASGLAPTLGDLVKSVVGEMPAVEGSDPRSWRYIDKTHLLELSKSATTSPTARVRLWVATMIWGRALDNRGPGKIARAVDCRTVAGIAERLDASFDLVQQGKLAEAYAACLQGGPGSFTTIGPSFFTKWLWSAGLSLPNDRVRPLILDSNVLTAREGIDSWVLHGATPGERWAYYCELTAEVARALVPQFVGIDAEKIEYAFFCLGTPRGTK